MAPFPEEVDVFTAPHWRMKQLVGLYCDKVLRRVARAGGVSPRHCSVRVRTLPPPPARRKNGLLTAQLSLLSRPSSFSLSPPTSAPLFPPPHIIAPHPGVSPPPQTFRCSPSLLRASRRRRRRRYRRASVGNRRQRKFTGYGFCTTWPGRSSRPLGGVVVVHRNTFPISPDH